MQIRYYLNFKKLLNYKVFMPLILQKNAYLAILLCKIANYAQQNLFAPNAMNTITLIPLSKIV